MFDVGYGYALACVAGYHAVKSNGVITINKYCSMGRWAMKNPINVLNTSSQKKKRSGCGKTTKSLYRVFFRV